jgi:hypothetical protein
VIDALRELILRAICLVVGHELDDNSVPSDEVIVRHCVRGNHEVIE